MDSLRHVLLTTCQDSPGLIHKITGALLKHALNITENSEFVDHRNQMFFMRTEFTGSFKSDALLRDLRSELPLGAQLELCEQRSRRIVLFATKEPHCLGDLLLRHSAGELNAKILAVISQYDSLAELTSKFGIPFHCVPVGELSREAHDEALSKTIAGYSPDLLVLAKYMRVLGPNFVSQFKNRIINIHHSFLPAFIGKNPYLQAYERGVKIIGATAHFVNENLDDGPIITQSVIPVTHSQDATDLARAGRDVEKIVLARAVRLALENRIIVHGPRTLVFE
jgi:formyltetrahydrofolate deformylase